MSCSFPKADGSPCSVEAPLYADGGCLWHSQDPEAKRKRAAARSNGGKASRKRTARTVDADAVPGGPPETLEDAVAWASWATFAVATGQIDARTSQEIVRAAKETRLGLEKLHLEGELRRQRAEIKRLNKLVSG